MVTLKIALFAVLFFALTSDVHQQVVVGDPDWLVSQECSSPTSDQCVLEETMKQTLREGPVLVEPIPELAQH